MRIFHERIHEDDPPKIPITIALHGFSGGRFYRGRYVYVVRVKLPAVPHWWNHPSQAAYEQTKTLCRSLEGIEGKSYLGQSRWKPYVGRERYYEQTFSFSDGDVITSRLFGLSASQLFYRHCCRESIWAIDRGRSGWWWVYSKELPMWRIPRRKDRAGRIPKEYNWLFSPMVELYDKAIESAEDFVTDYTIFDTGQNRKPPVWVCNLCEHSAVWEEWDWRDEFSWKVKAPQYGAMFHHISHCPNCGATARGGMFEQIEDALEPKPEAFRPYSRMQDDYLFTA